MPRTALRLLAVLIAAAAMLALAAPAWAHTSVVSVEPGDGSTVTAPEAVRVTFSDDLLELGARLSLRDADGAEVPIGELYMDGARVIAADLPALAGGQYTVAYRAVAGDGHPLEGTYEFTVEAAPEPSPSPSPSASATSAPSGAATPAPSPSAVPGEAEPASGPAMQWWWIAIVAGMAAIAVVLRSRR